MKKIQLLFLRLLQIFLFLPLFTESYAQTDAWNYADSMMNTSEGELLFEEFLEDESEIPDSTQNAESAYLAAMYFYLGEWYAEHGHLCTAIRNDPDSLCYNEKWLLSNQSDDFLEGWEICEGSRRGMPIDNCDSDILMYHSLPDEARPTISEDPDPGFRFNLNPLDNALIEDLNPFSIRQFANYDACELNLVNDGKEDIGTKGLLPMYPPSGGSSIRINNERSRYHVNTIRKYFVPDESAPIYYFSYAYVLEDPDHPEDRQPFFRAILRDETCAVVEERCFIAQIGADGSEFVINEDFDAPIVYKQWSCDSFDLTPYIEMNQLMSIEFIAADCGAGQHFGYAYVADICQPCGNGPSIVLDSTQYICPDFPIEFCGNIFIPDGYELLDLNLLIYQTLDSLGQADSLVYNDTTGNFCFYILEEDVENLLNGGYDVYAFAELINPVGDTIVLTSLSAFPNTVESTDNDFFLGLFEECVELTAFIDCMDSTLIAVHGTYFPGGEGLDPYDLDSTFMVIDGDTIYLELQGHDDINGYFDLTGNSPDGFDCPDTIDIFIPAEELEDTLHFTIEVCGDSCMQVGYWHPEIPICASGDSMTICGDYLAPRDEEGYFELEEVIVCAISDNQTIALSTSFSINEDILCVTIPISELIDSCYELTVTLIYLSNDDEPFVSVISDLVTDTTDICFPLDDCCPVLDLVWVVDIENMECIDGGSSGDKIIAMEFVLYLPDGFIECDNEPIFEDGYFDYDTYSYSSTTNTIHIAGEYHITDISGFDEDYVIRGFIELCDESDTSIVCPANFEIAKIDCHTNCAEDPCAHGVVCDDDLDVTYVHGGWTYLTYCIYLIEPGGECDYGDYDIYIYDEYGVVVSHSVVEARVGLGGLYCFEFEYETELEEICLDIFVYNDCTELDYCESTICVENEAFSGGGNIESRSTAFSEPKFMVTPNPATTNELRVLSSDMSVDEVDITIYDVNGQLVQNDHVQLSLGVGNLLLKYIPGGYYYLKISPSNRSADSSYLPVVIIK